MNMAGASCLGSDYIQLARVARPAQLAMFLETGPAGPSVYTRDIWVFGTPLGDYPISFNWALPWCWWPYQYNAPHNDMMNVACWDGHVKSVKPLIPASMDASGLPDQWEVGGGIYWNDRP